MNRILRICAEKQDNLESVCKVQGGLVVFFNTENTFAYGAALKHQGGNDYGDFHIIGFKDENSNWQFNVGNFKPFDGFYDEMAETAANFPGFNIDDAKKYIESDDSISLYNYYERFNMDAYYDEITDNCVENDKKVLDEYIDEDNGSKLILLENIKNAEESNGYLWYSEDSCDESLIKQLNDEDAIISISNLITGNIHFLR